MYDIAIVGSGPAGLSAAINCKIRNKSVIVFGQKNLSDMLSKAPKIDNYLGFPSISGSDLIQNFLQHAATLGIEISEKKVKEIFPTGKSFGLLVGQDIISAQKVILATGINYNADLSGETELLGNGVGYCATCDAALYKEKEIIIVGYGKTAEEEVDFCKGICGKVRYLPTYKAKDFDVEVIHDYPKAVKKTEDKITLVCKKGEYVADGVFILREAMSPRQLVKNLEMSGKHIKVNNDMQTNIKGLYACGDVVGTPYQIAKAVGQGQIAALKACTE